MIYTSQKNGTSVEDVNFTAKCGYASANIIGSQFDPSWGPEHLDTIVADIEPYKGPKSIGNMIVERFPWAQAIFRAHGRLGADFRTYAKYLEMEFPNRVVYYYAGGSWQELEAWLKIAAVMIFTDKGKLTKSGHYIVLRRATPDGRYYAADPWFGDGKIYKRSELVFKNPYFLVMV